MLRPTFLKCQDYPSRQDQLLFFLGWDFSIETWLRRDLFRDCQVKLRLSRFLRFVKTFQDLSRYHNIIIFEVLQDKKSRQLVLSRSWSRLLVLEGGVETKLRFLNLDQNTSIVKTNFFSVSRFFSTVETDFLRCRDRESWSRPRQDKSRPPCLA